MFWLPDWKDWADWDGEEDEKRLATAVSYVGTQAGATMWRRQREITLSQDFFFFFFSSLPLQRIFILNQKAHYSTCRLACPLCPVEM